MNRLFSFWKDEAGASAAEYALMLAIIGSALALAAVSLGNAIGDSMNTTASCISSNGATC